MVEGGVSDNSSTEGHWRIAESIVAWFEEADDPDFVLTYAYAKRREDNDRFRELYEQYKKELK